MMMMMWRSLMMISMIDYCRNVSICRTSMTWRFEWSSIRRSFCSPNCSSMSERSSNLLSSTTDCSICSTTTCCTLCSTTCCTLCSAICDALFSTIRSSLCSRLPATRSSLCSRFVWLRVELSTCFNSISRTNCLCFCENSVLMKSSMRIVDDEIHCMLSRFACISWLNQCLWTSTCLNLIVYCVVRLISTRIVCILSYFIWMICESSKLITLKNLCYQITFLSITDIVNNSISIVLMITIFCLLIFQSIRLLNSLKAYFCALRLIAESST